MTTVKKTFWIAASLVFFLIVSPMRAVVGFFRICLQPGTNDRFPLITAVYAEVLSTREEALKRLLPDATEITEQIQTLSPEQFQRVAEKADIRLEPGLDERFHFFAAKKNGAVFRYAVQDTVHGKWGPISYMLALDPSGKVEDALILEYHEKRGRPVAKRRFLKQFIGKSSRDDLKIMRDIRSVTGASISSRGMTDGIRKLVFVFEEFYGAVKS